MNFNYYHHRVRVHVPKIEMGIVIFKEELRNLRLDPLYIVRISKTTIPQHCADKLMLLFTSIAEIITF